MNRIGAVIAIALGLATSPAAYATGVVAHPPASVGDAVCRGVIDHVAAATGARFDHRSFSGMFAVFRHRDVEELAVSCSHGNQLPTIEANLQNAYPQEGFYHTLAQAGAALVGQPVPAVEQSLRRCYKMAIHDDEETGVVESGSLHVECQAFLREDGSMMMAVSRATHPVTVPVHFPRAPAPAAGNHTGPAG